VHLTILSRSAGIYTTRRLVDAARLAGHRVRVLNPLKCEMFLDGTEPLLYHQGAPIPRTDVCIPRVGQSIQNYALAVVDQLAQKGIPLLNTAVAIARSRNKIRCLQHLSAHGIPVPATVMASNARSIAEMVSMVGGCPVLLKLLHGGERVGVMVCETVQSMEAALEALLGMGHYLIVQQSVRETKGRDIRALVVGGRVIAAVRREPRAGRLHRTLGAGARFEPARLPESFVRIAENTANLVALEVAAIDMLDLKDGPRVFEVNSSPGIKEIEDVTGVDVAREIVARAAELARAGKKIVEPASSKALSGEGCLGETITGERAPMKRARRAGRATKSS
jgi:ribosomal protein S6--L-glutamate ligase